MRLCKFVALAAVAIACSGHSYAIAQLPAARLLSVFPLGGRQGTEVAVTIKGTDLDNVARLSFSHPGITAQPKLADGKPSPNQFVVTISPDVPVGRHEVRAVGRYGVSNPRAFLVGDRPQSLEQEPNNTLEQSGEIALGSVIDGQADGATPDVFKFRASASQRVLIECRGPQLDSQIDPTLVLFDPAGRELAADRRSGMGALVDFTVPADGEYAVRVFDFLYRGGNEYSYQLSVGSQPMIDFILPPAGLPGTKAQFTLFGRNLPGGAPAEGVLVDGRQLEKLVVEMDVPTGDAIAELRYGELVRPPETVLDGFEYRLQTPAGASNAVLIGYATAPIVMEQEPNDSPAAAQRLNIPCEYAGQFSAAHDQDWITFEAKKKEVYWIEVFSQRLGAATDPSFVLQQVKKGEKGQEQTSEIRQEDDFAPNIGGVVFNTNTGDPQYRFLVPDDGTYRLMLRDLYDSGDPRSIYRLSIRPERPDFRIVAFPQLLNNQPANQQQPAVWSTLLRKGGAESLQVLAFRRDNFAGEIELTAEGLPPGVHAAPAVLGPGRNVTTVVLTADENAPEWTGSFRVVGKGRAGEKELVRAARAGTIVWPSQQNGPPGVARMAAGLALAVCPETAQFTVSADGDQKWEVSRGGKLQIPIKITRRSGFTDKVTLNPIDLPSNVQAGNVTINGNQNDGKLALSAGNSAPLGTYTFYLRADAKLSYRRDAEATGEDAKPKNIDVFVPVAITLKIAEQPEPAKKE
ncbi:MAG: hypothetical protein HY000_25410 [Planctomycetes bacterium]|nr:hypothetical protein [Planctomycetota bacterium]